MLSVALSVATWSVATSEPPSVVATQRQVVWSQTDPARQVRSCGVHRFQSVRVGK